MNLPCQIYQIVKKTTKALLKFGLKRMTNRIYSHSNVFFIVIIIIIFLSAFSFTNIHEPQACKGSGRAFLQLLTTTSTRFTDTQTLAGQLLQRAYLCTHLAAGLDSLISEHKSLTTKLCVRCEEILKTIYSLKATKNH